MYQLVMTVLEIMGVQLRLVPLNCLMILCSVEVGMYKSPQSFLGNIAIFNI